MTGLGVVQFTCYSAVKPDKRTFNSMMSSSVVLKAKMATQTQEPISNCRLRDPLPAFSALQASRGRG